MIERPITTTIKAGGSAMQVHKLVLVAAVVAAVALPAPAFASWRGGARDVRALTVHVPARVHRGDTYRIRVSGARSGYLIVAIAYSARPCARTAQEENRRRAVQFLSMTPRGEPGLFVGSPFRHVDKLEARTTDRRTVCAYLYRRRLTDPRSRMRPLARAEARYEVIGG